MRRHVDDAVEELSLAVVVCWRDAIAFTQDGTGDGA
jgi:hypothetical protein